MTLTAGDKAIVKDIAYEVVKEIVEQQKNILRGYFKWLMFGVVFGGMTGGGGMVLGIMKLAGTL